MKVVVNSCNALFTMYCMYYVSGSGRSDEILRGNIVKCSIQYAHRPHSVVTLFLCTDHSSPGRDQGSSQETSAQATATGDLKETSQSSL